MNVDEIVNVILALLFGAPVFLGLIEGLVRRSTTGHRPPGAVPDRLAVTVTSLLAVLAPVFIVFGLGSQGVAHPAINGVMFTVVVSGWIVLTFNIGSVIVQQRRIGKALFLGLVVIPVVGLIGYVESMIWSAVCHIEGCLPDLGFLTG